jgi:hypothetical protein
MPSPFRRLYFYGSPPIMVKGKCLRPMSADLQPMEAERLFFENRMLEKIGYDVKKRCIPTLATKTLS